MDFVITPLTYDSDIEPDTLDVLSGFQKTITAFIFGPIKICLIFSFYRMAERYLAEFYADTKDSLKCAHIIQFVMTFSLMTYIIEFIFVSVSVIFITYLNFELPETYSLVQNIIIGYSKKLMFMIQALFIIAVVSFITNYDYT